MINILFRIHIKQQHSYIKTDLKKRELTKVFKNILHGKSHIVVSILQLKTTTFNHF